MIPYHWDVMTQPLPQKYYCLKKFNTMRKISNLNNTINK